MSATTLIITKVDPIHFTAWLAGSHPGAWGEGRTADEATEDFIEALREWHAVGDVVECSCESTLTGAVEETDTP